MYAIGIDMLKITKGITQGYETCLRNSPKEVLTRRYEKKPHIPESLADQFFRTTKM